jgi:Pyruvate/2-oxoacid:ferredoxin oxidoreductase gamma subunit
MTILQELNKKEKEKYLIIKQAQDMLFTILTQKIRGKAHSLEAHAIFLQLAELDESIEALERSVEDAKATLAEMDIKDLKKTLKETEDFYKDVVSYGEYTTGVLQ